MSSQDDLQRLIVNCHRRLQKLKEQQASFGLYTPPYISVEIEDTEAELERLQTKLVGLSERLPEVMPLASVASAQTQVFISYSRRDITFVHQLAADLERAGLTTWWDVSNLTGGEIWTQTIEAALRDSRYCLVVLSPNSLQAEWVRKEYLYAMRLGLKPITLLYQTCEPPLALTDIQFIDFCHKPYRQGLQELLPLLGIGASLPPAPVLSATQPDSPDPPSFVERILAHSRLWLMFAGITVLLILAGVIYKSNTTNTLVDQPASIFDGKDVPMVSVPAGSFRMGSDSGEEQEQPVHQVTLDTFYIDRYEVTNIRYAACVREGVCTVPADTTSRTRSNYYGNAAYDDYPVIYITWNQAKTYCEWRGGGCPLKPSGKKRPEVRMDELIHGVKG